MTATDKQMYKRFNAGEGLTPHDLQALSPPQSYLGTSPAQGYLRYLWEGLKFMIFCSTKSAFIINYIYFVIRLRYLCICGHMLIHSHIFFLSTAVASLAMKRVRCATPSAERPCFTWSPHWMQPLIPIMTSRTPRVMILASNRVWRAWGTQWTAISTLLPMTIILKWAPLFGPLLTRRYRWPIVIFTGKYSVGFEDHYTLQIEQDTKLSIKLNFLHDARCVE